MRLLFIADGLESAELEESGSWLGELAGQQLLALRRGFGSRDWFETACEAAVTRYELRPDIYGAAPSSKRAA